jgi:hypothetical protein
MRRIGPDGRGARGSHHITPKSQQGSRSAAARYGGVQPFTSFSPLRARASPLGVAEQDGFPAVQSVRSPLKQAAVPKHPPSCSTARARSAPHAPSYAAAGAHAPPPAPAPAPAPSPRPKVRALAFFTPWTKFKFNLRHDMSVGVCGVGNERGSELAL